MSISALLWVQQHLLLCADGRIYPLVFDLIRQLFSADYEVQSWKDSDFFGVMQQISCGKLSFISFIKVDLE